MAMLDGNDGSETDRDHRDRYKMASYLWAPDSSHLLFDTNGRLWLYDLHNGTGVQVGFTGAASGDDPKFSPNGEYHFIHSRPRAFGDAAQGSWYAGGGSGSSAQAGNPEWRSGLGI